MKKFIALFLAILACVALLSACNSADPNQPWDDPSDPWHIQASPKIVTGTEDEEEEEETSAVQLFDQA